MGTTPSHTQIGNRKLVRSQNYVHLIYRKCKQQRFAIDSATKRLKLTFPGFPTAEKAISAIGKCRRIMVMIHGQQMQMQFIFIQYNAYKIITDRLVR